MDKKRVIDAIAKLGGRVTAADVTLETGLAPSVVTLNLNTIAWETGGRLEVSGKGDIAYSFSADFTAKYFVRGVKLFLQNALKRAFDITWFLLRMSFGVGLLLSIGVFLLITAPALVVSMFIAEYEELTEGDAAPTSKSKKNSRGKGKKKNPQAANKVNRKEIISRQADYLKLFCVKCFSQLFGEGDPNRNIDERKWQLIARLIRDRSYALISEQISPYTGSDPDDESSALPVLVRFNGAPEVTDAGNIVYVFPSLQTVIADGDQQALPDFLEEAEWVDSRFSDKELYPVRQLGLTNLIGSWVVWAWNRSSDGLHVPIVCNVIAGYGTAFLLLPGVRYLIRSKLNKRISLRNRQRLAYAKRLESPDEKLKAKLVDASQFKLSKIHIESSDIVYATDKAALDQPDELDKSFN
jgi:hypothetical protein